MPDQQDRTKLLKEFYERLLEDLLHADTTAWIPEDFGRKRKLWEEFNEKHGGVDWAGTLQRYFASRDGNAIEVPEELKEFVSYFDERNREEMRSMMLANLQSMDFSVIKQWHDAMTLAANIKKQEDPQKTEELENQKLRPDNTRL